MPTSNTIPFHSGNYESPEKQVRDHMSSRGIEPPSILVWDGQIHRFSTKNGVDDAGWYVLHGDNIPAGAYGDWRTDSWHIFVANMGRDLTASEIQENNKRISEARQRQAEERGKKQERASEECQRIWKDAHPALPGHAYLSRKGIQPHIAKVIGDGRLAVPLFNEDYTLATLQYISSDGDKKYHPGGAAGGKFCVLGDIDKKAFLVEGFATGATVYEETGIATVIAYSASNLEKVAGILRKQYEVLDLVIVADNDENGVGQAHATQTQAKHGGTIIMPPVTGDVNDYRQAGGNVHDLLMIEGDMSQRMKVVFGDELPEDYEVPDEIIQNLIVSNSLTVLYGDSNSGKTFFALSLAMAVSEGVSCYGRQVDKGLVLYLATEAPASIRNRMQALKKHHKKTLSNLAMVPVPLNFYSNAGDATAVITLVEELERAKGQKVKMIIADTLARMSAGANENSGEDMGPVMERFSMVASHTKAAVIVIHHIGKDQAKGARGWSGIRAHIDTEIEIIDAEGIKSAKVTKQRELGSKGEEIRFKLEIIPMGISKFGGDVTTCVATWNNDPFDQRWTVPQQKRLEVLLEMVKYYGGNPHDFPRLTREQIKKYLMKNQGMSEDTARKNMSEKDPSRFLGGLLKDKLLYESTGNFVVKYTSNTPKTPNQTGLDL